MIYDEIYFEDGTFYGAILEQGGGSNAFLPPGMLTKEERVIEFERDLKQGTFTSVLLPNDWTPSADNPSPSDMHIVLHGKTETRFKIDYFDIFRYINVDGLGFTKFITFSDSQFPGEVKYWINHQSFTDGYKFLDIDTNPFRRDLIIKSLNHDLAASMLLGSSVVIDEKHGELLRRKSETPSTEILTSEPREEVIVRKLFEIAAPNFAELSIEKVIELRQDII